MRLADVIKVLRNVPANVVVKWGGSDLIPAVEISGAALLNLYANSIWVAEIVGDGFLKRQVMWIDFKYELSFVPAPERGRVCRDALLAVAGAIKTGRAQIPSRGSEEYRIMDLLIAAEAITEVAARNVIASRDDYNAWVIETGGGADEKMSEDEHLDALKASIKDVRLKTYPIWSSLIDLLPDGITKTEAERLLRDGCGTVGLDTQDITPDWQIESV